tara:strand:- start:1866 stop:2345 length:480 start_codon:yes stop_codon:yes gene_type:complete
MCQPVDDPTSQYIQDCIARMKTVLKSMPNGIGLAASQVGLLLRIYVAYDKLEPGNPGDLVAYINPEFEPQSVLTPAIENEGCLSFPGITGDVMRPPSGKLSYINEQGEQVQEDVEGLKARCAQHEIDHLNGISLVQSMTDESKKKARAAIDRLGKRRRR